MWLCSFKFFGFSTVVPLPGAPAMPSLPEPVPELVAPDVPPLVIGGSVISVPPWPAEVVLKFAAV
jgi:hypothetical protein